MAKQDEYKAELNVSFLQQNLDALNKSAGQLKANAMYEAGRKAGQVEGQQLLLENMVNMFGEDAVAKVAPQLAEKPPEDAPKGK